MPVVAALPVVAVVTLVGVALLVVVLSSYLITVALILRHVVSRLETILDAVVAVNEESAPLGQVANAINADLEAGRGALEGALAQLPQPSSDHEGTGVAFGQPSGGV